MGRSLDRFPQLGRTRHRQGQVGLAHDGAEHLVGQRTVVEVGAQGEHHPDPAAGVGCCKDQVPDEQVARLVRRDDGIELFELVDDDDEFPL